MHFSFVVYARALITRASRFFSPLETHIWQSRVGSLTPLLNVTHSLAYDPCNRVFYMRINNNTGICQCAQANLTNYVLHFRVVCLSIYLNPSIRLSGRSLPSVRTRMERHRIAEIIERQHQHQIPAPSTKSIMSRFGVHESQKHAHHSAAARVTIEWHYTCSEYVMCARNLCAAFRRERIYLLERKGKKRKERKKKP